MTVNWNPRRLYQSLAIALAAGIAISAVPLQAIAQTYNPPNVGLPGRREGGGTRGDCAAAEKSLVALMPSNNFGYTTDEYPTFYWYVPQIGAEAAEFVLLDENNNEVYLTTFQIQNSPGIISLSLPHTAGFPPLQIGQNYHWFFSLICDYDDRSGDLFTDGWVQRTEIAPGSPLANRLDAEPVGNHPKVFAEEGIWFDALDLLVQQRQAEPGNAQANQQWATLLTSVGLEDFINEPFVLHVEGSMETSSASPSN